jgi:hypothetical protein
MSMNLPLIIQMKNITRLGLAILGVASVAGAAFPGKAETPDIFTRHGLPIPGVYFAKRESQQSATVAVDKAGRSVGEHKAKSGKQSAGRADQYSPQIRR